MPIQATSRIYPALAVICVFFVFVVGVTNLKTDPIENDEFRTLNHIEPVWHSEIYTIPETIRSVAKLSSQHGPLYFVVLNVWHKLVGSDLFSLRFLSVLFGVLSIAMVYRLANITGKRENAAAATIALSFLAFYIFHIEYLRMYTFLTLACGWVLLSYWYAGRKRPLSKWSWISLFVLAASIPYIHYMGGLILVAIGSYHLVFARRDKRWWRILAIMALAGLLFLPWIPVVVGGLAEHRLDPTAIRLPFIQAVYTVLSVSSNGILLLPPLVAGLVLLNIRRLNDSERYLAFVALWTVATLFLLNEFAPILIANRLRYSLVLAVPFSCLAIIGLRMLPAWRLLRFPFAFLWCMSFFYYLETEDYAIFTNIRQHETEKIPHYQDFIYESAKLPGNKELILSFHPNMILSSNKTLPYYRSVISRWAYIVHITYDENGELVMQSGHAKYGSLEAIAENSNGIWVLHNPEQTSLDDLPVYTDWFLQHFKACNRFLDRDTSVIEYYLRNDLPCDLVTNAKPFAVHYDNGIELANAHSEFVDSEFRVYLWWRETIGKEYSVSLQVFDSQMAKVRQLDAVISSEPIDAFSFDLSELPAGDYTVQLIVYNFETKQSVSGHVVNSEERFERTVTLDSFSLAEQT
ncbi:MAG: glycosyltransferase family 39 protein [Chloroflexi bacterium]|nr:glycosyltransferase family 39 protein [Chloroflexota bacterium]